MGYPSLWALGALSVLCILLAAAGLNWLRNLSFLSAPWKWAVGGVALVAIILLPALAFDLLPGLPHAREKNVTLNYPPQAEKLSISLFVQPPLAFQTEGETQVVALQFADHGSIPAQVTALKLDPESCFSLSPKSSPAGSSFGLPLSLTAGQTFATLFELHARATAGCRGPHPLIFEYAWSVEAEPKVVTHAPQRCRCGRHRGVRRKAAVIAKLSKADAVTAPAQAVVQEAAVSTSPLVVTSAWLRSFERLFHVISLVAAAILLPVLLALFNGTYQESQAKREIWKAIFPGILTLTQQHYLPINRRAQFLQDAIGPVLAAGSAIAIGDSALKLILERLLLLRAEVRRLNNAFGGYHFRSKPGEDLCGEISDDLWFTLLPYEDAASYEVFAGLLEQLFPKDVAIGESIDVNGRQKMNAFRSALSTLRTHLAPATATGSQTAKLQDISDLLEMFIALLAFECDRPLYPEWYDQAPRFKYKEFKQKGVGLTSPTGPLNGKEKEFNDLVDRYLQTIPRKCRDG